MAKMSSKTKNAIDNFMQLHNLGYTVGEIAQKYGIDPSTLYSYLGQIAKANGVTRKQLLNTPHSRHNYERHKSYTVMPKAVEEKVASESVIEVIHEVAPDPMIEPPTISEKHYIMTLLDMCQELLDETAEIISKTSKILKEEF